MGVINRLQYVCRVCKNLSDSGNLASATELFTRHGVTTKKEYYKHGSKVFSKG